MRHTAIITTALLIAGLTVGCSSNDKNDAKPEAATPKAPASVTATQVLSEEEISQQCTDAVAEAAPGWEDWNLDIAGWKDATETPEVCKSLDNLAFHQAFIDGLDIAAACDTPAALPGKC
ncbi:hypothetical protein [Streptomyces apricus]|uniref:Uncharacterized protein n=1 Tax=Streptomyces apricus TaxID=1828112 RepID=A0A5B0B0U8_9ACTN|nr:hypothetical protein [Streptomyces apricus]KAA0935126.1 hypothetical protein FGF04_13425 [Streptomyces apricus]